VYRKSKEIQIPGAYGPSHPLTSLRTAMNSLATARSCWLYASASDESCFLPPSPLTV
jgi:hypothetical protein